MASSPTQKVRSNRCFAVAHIGQRTDDARRAARATGNHGGLVAALVRMSSQQIDLVAAVGALRQAAQVVLTAQDDVPTAKKLLGDALVRIDAAPTVTPAQKEQVRRALGQVLVPLFDFGPSEGNTSFAQELAQRAIHEADLTGTHAADMQVHLGQEALSAGKSDDAIRFFDAALSASPGLLEPTLALLELLGPSGNHARIDDLIEAALKATSTGKAFCPMQSGRDFCANKQRHGKSWDGSTERWAR